MHGIQEIDGSTLIEWLQDDKIFDLIDVRSDMELADGMIPKGQALPLHLLPLKAHELEGEAPIVFYCRSGARSAQACMFMASRGHGNVYNLRGGVIDWAQNGFPLVNAVA